MNCHDTNSFMKNQYIKRPINNNGEGQFFQMMTNKGFTLIHNPYLKEIRMIPDFYCVEDKTYYEVIGSRQAYHLRKDKMHKAQKLGVNLKIVNPDGTLYIPQKRGPSINNPKRIEAYSRALKIKKYLKSGLRQSEIAKRLNMSTALVSYWRIQIIKYNI